ncbi:hypothetical protein SAMN02745781_00907 [Vibrio gazogenes DSM 21264]|uniref:Uncharacterized protein n=1 Tax=Vibrio gazogenes DSM 21264 = NBRC 103151 TaxID=1123492 RepID=A0A1M4WUI3_VIBGA|nr:hypothetical protein SAMN02745781_00907 [Vibrio gazogenes DSM 21264] [Vibrio gazogenes DSM 21264 = NBRC 103151]SJN58496.1 hypothetical protein BQ6471_03047 [Vibrio gazogenes]
MHDPFNIPPVISFTDAEPSCLWSGGTSSQCCATTWPMKRIDTFAGATRFFL